jgi:hypothetical protein
LRTYIIHCKSILLSLFFLLNLALTCLQAQEHGKPGIITGRVVLDDGSPAVGANVLVGDTRFILSKISCISIWLSFLLCTKAIEPARARAICS